MGGIPAVRLTRFQLFLIGGLTLAILGPAVFSQPGNFQGGGRGGGRGGRGGGRGGMDPNAMFDRYSGGADTFDVNQVTVPEMMQRWMGTTEQLREQMTTFLQKKGITNGRFPRNLFAEYQDESRQQMRERFQQMRANGGMPGGPPGPGGPGGSTAPSSPADLAAEDTRIEEEARRFFPSMDRNGDGVIDREEARRSEALRDFDRWDKNKDGKISVDEYVEAYKEQQGQRGRGTRGAQIRAAGGSVGGAAPAAVPEEDKRPTVYRTGNLPKELTEAAPWFVEYDTDQDAQIGLYEWLAQGRPANEFKAMDLNGDGFLTVEEILRYHRATTKKDDKSKGPSTGGDAAGGQDGRGGQDARGGRGRGGRGGRGGPPGMMPGGGGPGGRGMRGPPGGGRGRMPGMPGADAGGQGDDNGGRRGRDGRGGRGGRDG
jgi:Ca2+-binding EF-hand superfamily protein